MKPFLQTVRDLCFPPRCVGCGDRLPPSVGMKKAPFFCPVCAPLWEQSLLSQCPDCFAAYCDCRCQPKIMERAGSLGLIKLAPYTDAGEHATVRRAVYGMKRSPRSRTFNCCAEELAPALCRTVEKQNEKTPISHTVITYLPRSRKSVRRYGFDQARELAKCLSRLTDYPCLSLLERVKDGTEQKTLTVKERQSNLKGAFRAVNSAEGCRVILVDDLVTTGAGMAEGVRVLRKNGAAEVLSVSVAVTPKKYSRETLAKFS